jgi:hypothetical protein
MPRELSIEELKDVSAGDTGGIYITHGGNNNNVAQGHFPEAAWVIGHGGAITSGGSNKSPARGIGA